MKRHSHSTTTSPKIGRAELQLLMLIAFLLCVLLCGCGTSKVANRQSIGPAPTAKPKVVYVADFELDAADIRSEKGLLPPPPKLPGLGDKLPALPGAPKDPKKLARQLVDEMSEALVKDLQKAGLQARRIAAGLAHPSTGWLIRGVFTDVNQGHQLRRAVIGFGMGKTDLQVVVDVCDLTQGPPRTFYELNTTADSGKAPGAGPTIVLGPAGVVARIVVAGKDLDRNVKQTASKIAGEVVLRTQQAGIASTVQ